MEANYFQILLGSLLSTVRRRVHHTWQEVSNGLDGVKQWYFSAAACSSTYLKGFWKNLREVRNVSKVHLLTLLNKKLFPSSVFLFFPALLPLPRWLWTKLLSLCSSLHSGIIKTWSTVCWNPWKKTPMDFRIIIVPVGMKAASCISP